MELAQSSARSVQVDHVTITRSKTKNSKFLTRFQSLLRRSIIYERTNRCVVISFPGHLSWSENEAFSDLHFCTLTLIFLHSDLCHF